MKVEGHYYTYIFECFDGHYYVGFTNDLDLRINQHNYGIEPKCYTFKRRPVRFAYHERYHDVHRAMEREKQIKKWSRAKKDGACCRRCRGIEISLSEFAEKAEPRR